MGLGIHTEGAQVKVGGEGFRGGDGGGSVPEVSVGVADAVAAILVGNEAFLRKTKGWVSEWTRRNKRGNKRMNNSEKGAATRDA